MLTRDQRIAMFKTQRKTQAQAEARADADIARAADLAAAQAVTKAACDHANSLKWTPGTPHPGPPVWNATLKRWERKSS